MRRWWIWCVGALVLAAGCTTPAAGGDDAQPPPTGPVINKFVASATVAPAPALITLTWTVSDPAGDPVTCRVDTDGDGSTDLTIPNCAGTTSHNTSFATAGGRTPTLEVDDGTTVVTASVPLTITTGVSESFDITVLPVGSLTGPQQTAFNAAATKWESAIVRGIPDTPVSLPVGACFPATPGFPASPAIDQTVDDLLIVAQIKPIDGPGGVLGEAGPCAVSPVDHLTRVGTMQFDSADVADMIGNGTFTQVVTHEMGHVLGFGTLWNSGRALLQGSGGGDPRFLGPRANAEYAALGGSGTIPVENSGGDGTANAHWREAIFGNELMTGFINAGPNPLSAMSIASMADMGYQVSLGAADPYSLPGSAFRAQSSSPPIDGVMLRPPVIVLPG
jgi:Leishmanolysin